MYYLIVLDDDELHNRFIRNKLEAIIRKRKLEASVAVNTTMPGEVLEYSAKYKDRNNIYLLDVNVQDTITGIDIAKIIRGQEPGAYIVFVSAYPEYVMQSLKTRIFDYLIKPVTEEMLEACIQAILNDHKKVIDNGTQQMISIKSGFETYQIPLEEIMYFEKFGHVLVVHTATGRIEGNESLDRMERRLDQDKFFRCHKSYLVHLTSITHIDYSNNMIFLANGEKCPVSKRNKKELRLLCKH